MAARNDLVLMLASAALNFDREKAQSAIAMIKSHEKESTSLHRSLSMLSNRKLPEESIIHLNKAKDLVMLEDCQKSLSDLMLSTENKKQIDTLIAEYKNKQKLIDNGFNPRHRLFLSGPPGTGKTTLAGVLAHELELPLLVANYTKIVESFMGSTGANLGKLFNDIGSQPCVLFIDEMESILSERSSNNDVGEQARIVSTLLMLMDRLPNEVILIGATNHAEMLDRAVLRRFEMKLTMDLPSSSMHGAWYDHFCQNHNSLPLIAAKDSYLLAVEGESISFGENLMEAACREHILFDRSVSDAIKHNS